MLPALKTQPSEPVVFFDHVARRLGWGSSSAATGLTYLIQKLFRRDQIGGAETLCKAVIDRLEAGDGVGGASLDHAEGGRG